MSNATYSRLLRSKSPLTLAKPFRIRILSTSIGVLLGAGSFTVSHAAEIVKATNTNTLNTAISWVGGAVPGANDVAVWDSTVSAPNSSQIGSDLSWLGIKVNNVGGTRNAGNVVTIANTGSANTLTLGSAGIDMSAALQTLVIQSRIAIAANQTWNVSDANTSVNPAGLNQNEDLTFFAQAAATSADLGGFTVTKAGVGTTAFSSGWTISNGSFLVNEGILHIQGGSNRVTTVDSSVNFTVNNGATLRFASQSGAGGVSLQNNAPITLNNGSTLAFHLNQNNALNLTGNITVNGNTTWNPFGANFTTAQATFSGNLLGSGNISYLNTATNTTGFLRFAGDNSGFSGTISLNGTSNNRSLRLVSSTAGSAAATWNVAANNILQIDGQSVSLGTLTGAGTVTNTSSGSAAMISVGAGSFSGAISDGSAPMSVTKVGPGTLELVGSNLYSGPTVVSGGTLLFGADSPALSNVTVADGATFGVKLMNPGTTLSLPGLTVGSTTGSNLRFELGSFGNPTAPGISVANFTATAPTKLFVAAANLTPGTFTLIDYNGSIGGLGAGALTLSLPPRVAGTLVNNTGNTSIDVTITGQDAPKWTGATNGNWDIDSGGGSGTANWKELISGNVTKFLQNATGGDIVLFDDSATGTTNVNLTTELRPLDVTVNNSVRDYTFSGTGKLSGATKLTKSGSSTLIITNTGGNDYTGGTVINTGTLQVGDGTTPGAGSLGNGPVEIVSGGLVLSRPDDFTINGAVNAAGNQITKNAAGTATITGRLSTSGALVLNGGTLRLTNGADLSGQISGAGSLTLAGGTTSISGFDANTFTGPVRITAGTLQLNKPFDTNAVSNSISITGNGTLTSTAGNQIPDTATITLDSDGANSTVGNDTIANAILSPVTPGAPGTGQLIAHTGLVISDTMTIGGRIFSVASGHSASANRIVQTGGTVRIAANSGPSTLDVGSGGMTSSGGIIEVGQGTGAFDAVLNMGGNLATTGNLEINRGGFTGTEKREINLTADRTFTIGAGTTTNVRPEVAGVGGLTKAGGGTLNLLGNALYTGPTIVAGGTLATSTSQTWASSITVGDGGNLRVGVASPGSTLTVPAITLGSSAGGQLTIAFGSLGLQTTAPISTANLIANGNSLLVIEGTTSVGTFPLLDYTGTIGGAGFGALKLALPNRVAGNLVANAANTSIDLQITGVDSLRWIGNVSSTWDIDNGTGTGTANWKGVSSGTAYRYLQGSGAPDTVLFDDAATGSTTIDLNTTVTPTGVTVNNNALTYQFTGGGKISGSTGLVKQGPGLLVVGTDNDYTGGTTISGGTVDVGGGGETGQLGSGAITNNGSLVISRSNTLALNNTISGTGSLTKTGSGTVSLGGSATNTYTGLTMIEGGTLQLNKADGIVSLPGDAVVNAGTLSWSQPNQVADSANLTVNGGSINSGNRADTFANLTINSPSPTSTFSGLTVTGTLTVSAGTHDAVNSNGVLFTEKAVLSNSTVKLGVNSGPSTWTIGAGGLTMTDATIQYGSAGNAAQTGTVILGGNVTASGTNFFDINSGNPISILDLGSLSRIIDVVSGVTTIEASVQSLSGNAGFTKAGTGALVLAGNNNTYTGDTVIQEGTLEVRGSIFGTPNILVKLGATLDVLNVLGGFELGNNQTLKGVGTVSGDALISGTLAPGEGIGTLAFAGNLTLAGTAAYEINKTGLTLGVDLANVSGLLTLGGILNVTATGSPLSNGDSFNLFDAGAFAGKFANVNLPALAPGLSWDTSKLAVDGSLTVIPEPSAALLLASGLSVLGMQRRRQRR